MGYYIQTESTFGKARSLILNHKAVRISEPNSFAEVPANKGLICVVDNYMFEAAGFCYSESEFRTFASPDGREKIWLLMDLELAKKLSGYTS
jgi:hypothetical protein